MITEDLSIFFSDFGVQATWSPSNGGQVQTAQVLFDVNGETLQFDGFGAFGREISITYKAIDFVGLDINEAVTVNGKSYRVRGEPQEVDGGAFMRAMLGKYDE